MKRGRKVVLQAGQGQRLDHGVGSMECGWPLTRILRRRYNGVYRYCIGPGSGMRQHTWDKKDSGWYKKDPGVTPGSYPWSKKRESVTRLFQIAQEGQQPFIQRCRVARVEKPEGEVVWAKPA